MKQTIPFLALGLLAATGFFLAGPPAQGQPAEDDGTGSVRVEAQLEHGKLLAEKGGETFARIVLEGKQTPAPTDRVPVSLTLVIDQSGSMAGEKIDHARRSAILALEQLLPGDRASVVAFSDGARVLVDRVVIGEQPLDDARRAISALRDMGGTDMVAGLDVGGRQAKKLFEDRRTNRVLLLSDGQPNTEQGLKAQVQQLARQGILTTTLGIGRDYNEDLMSRLADAGLGNYYFIERPEMTASIFDKELKTLASVVAKEAVVTISLKSGVVVEEVYGYDISRGKDVVAIPVGDVYGGRKSDILARVRFPAATEGKAELLEVKVSYHDALAARARKVSLPLAAHFTKDAAAVTASVVPAVAEKAEKVRTAFALEQVTEAYAKGDKDRARSIVAEQKARLGSLKGRFAGTAVEKSAEAFEDELDSLSAEAEAPAADAKVYSKKAKAAARAYKKR